LIFNYLTILLFYYFIILLFYYFIILTTILEINLLISEFIKEDKVYDTKHKQVELLIHECLIQLQPVYGFDNCEWVFEAVDDEETNLEPLPDNLIDIIRDTTNTMTGEIKLCIYRDNGLFKYKKKTLFRVNNEIIVDKEYYLKPLFWALKRLVNIYDEQHPCIDEVIEITQLVECSRQLDLLVQLNWLWICEAQKNFKPEKVDKKNQEFDQLPVNIERKKELQNLVISELLKNDTLTLNELRKLTKKSYEKKLDELYTKNIIGEEDITVSGSVTARWIEETILMFNNEDD
jgi:hypothetical protein